MTDEKVPGPVSQRMRRLGNRMRDLPDDVRLAGLGAWRGRERGVAVLAGVFLASLVITTVLSYGVGLSQIFFQESLEAEPFDAKIEFRRAPAPDVEGWTNDTDALVEACGELTERVEISDCTVIFGRQGIHGGGFFNEDFIVAQPLEMRSVTSTDGLWDNVTFDYPDPSEQGPPISDKRGVRILGPGAFDGEIASRLGEQIIFGMGNWSSPAVVEAERGVFLPSTVASEAEAEVGDVLDTLTFAYVVDSNPTIEGGIPDEECVGEVDISQSQIEYCRIDMTMTNLTVLGIYEPWAIGNPTLTANPIFTTWTAMPDEDRRALIDQDHIYLGVTIDRTLLPTSSTDAAAEWVQDLGNDIEDSNYSSANIEVFYFDIVGGTITFLRIFLGLIQTFDYIIMIPIVILSFSVLIYGLVLSLEQRRREISIHRVIGATSKGLRWMVLLELTVMAFFAWLIGYLVAMAAVPVVLSSVGFMVFRRGEYSVDPRISFAATALTAIATLGLAVMFGRARTKEFIEMEIDEGVRKVRAQPKPKTWLHVVALAIGLIAMIDTWMEMNGSESGLNSNFFIEGLLGIFGPFLLWIGGSLLLGRIGAAGPRMMQAILGRTTLLKDVKRGLKGSGSAESVNRLAVIVILTLSIVTLAAVQGHTGTIVDERTSSATVGSDLQIIMEQPSNASAVEIAIEEVHGVELSMISTNVPTLALTGPEGDSIQAWVLLNSSQRALDWTEQAVPGEDIDSALSAYSGLTFSAGETAAYNLDLWGSGRRGGDQGDILLDVEDDRTDNLTFTYEAIEFVISGLEVPEDPSDLDLEGLLVNYSAMMDVNLSSLDLTGQNLSGRDLSRTDLSGADLSGADLSGANLSESLLFTTNLMGANLSGAMLNDAIVVEFGPSMMGANLSSANLSGAFGAFDLSVVANLQNASCPDGSVANETSCANASSAMPPPMAASLLAGDISLDRNSTVTNVTLRYIGVHWFVPGISMSTMEDSIVIGEDAWRRLVGEDAAANHTATTWIVSLDGVSGSELEALRANLEADSRVASAMDWSSEHKEVERNGGLIFGTPGLLSLQFVVASVAAVASSFVFLSLVLNQRQKELAILQAVGASSNQIIRLVLFEIVSIVSVSMLLGVGLGIGVALSFNGLFEVFGFIFQIFMGSTTVIERNLVYPWMQLGMVALTVFAAVVAALLLTTRKALGSDLATVLKGE